VIKKNKKLIPTVVRKAHQGDLGQGPQKPPLNLFNINSQHHFYPDD
jgi:hypothetical protein